MGARLGSWGRTVISSNDRKIARRAPILTSFRPNESSRRDLLTGKNDQNNETNEKFSTSTGRRGGRSGVRVYKAGRSPDETKRDEMKGSENERNEKNETHRIFRIAEVTCDLQSLDAFFLFTFGRHFRVSARLQKNVHSAERALLRFIFSCEKSQSFVAIWNNFPNLAQFFERPILADQSSANSSRLLTKLSGMLRFGVRFSRRMF